MKKAQIRITDVLLKLSLKKLLPDDSEIYSVRDSQYAPGCFEIFFMSNNDSIPESMEGAEPPLLGMKYYP